MGGRPQKKHTLEKSVTSRVFHIFSAGIRDQGVNMQASQVHFPKQGPKETLWVLSLKF
jgi:hypothetical protein